MITVSPREGRDPCGVHPLAADEPRVGFNKKPATGDRMSRRPSPDRSREGAVGTEETIMLDSNLPSVPRRDPWNKGRLIGQKRPLKPKDVWSIRVRLQVERRARNLALFNLAIDSKLRGCDLVRLQVDDVSLGGRVRDRAPIAQKKTGRGAIRDHRADPRRDPGVACRHSKPEHPVPLSQPGPNAAAPVDPAVYPDRPFLGRERWA